MSESDTSVKTALLLAAGAGTRMRSITEGIPKCLTVVSGKPILGRLLEALNEQNFNRLVVVVGYRSDQVEEYLALHAGDLEVVCVKNDLYAETNNIYSLWIARHELDESFMLIESDLVVDSELLTGMRVDNRIAVALYQEDMNGTTVSVDESKMVRSFSVGGKGDPILPYKTVNMYSISTDVWQEVDRRVDARILAGAVNDYYEVVFADMAADGVFPFQIVEFDHGRWSEIDTPEDLAVAQELFSKPKLRS